MSGLFARSSAKLFARPAARFASSGAAKSADAIPEQLYKNVWRKSNIMYITYILAGCVVIEGVYGTLTNTLWESKNSGVSKEGHCLQHRTTSRAKYPSYHNRLGVRRLTLSFFLLFHTLTRQSPSCIPHHLPETV